MFGFRTAGRALHGYGRLAEEISSTGARMATHGLEGMARTSGGSALAHQGYNMIRKGGNFVAKHPHATLYGGIGLGYSMAGKGGVLGWPGRHATSQPGGHMRAGRDPRAPYSSGAAGLTAHSTGGYA
jgi:hypothetical protein